MKTDSIIIVGAGGFGRETIDVLKALHKAEPGLHPQLLGVVDDSPSEINLTRLKDLGVNYLGTISQSLDLATIDTLFSVAVGSPSTRAKIANTIKAAGFGFATLIHPTAVIGSAFESGEGITICGGVQISTNVYLGSQVHINPNATIGHDAQLSDFVSINPGAIISGEVTIHRETLIGAGAVVLQGLSIAEQCIIGAAACVVRDVTSAGRILKGIPAK